MNKHEQQTQDTVGFHNLIFHIHLMILSPSLITPCIEGHINIFLCLIFFQML